jgi:hypothetical protein
MGDGEVPPHKLDEILDKLQSLDAKAISITPCRLSKAENNLLANHPDSILVNLSQISASNLLFGVFNQATICLQ